MDSVQNCDSYININHHKPIDLIRMFINLSSDNSQHEFEDFQKIDIGRSSQIFPDLRFAVSKCDVMNKTTAITACSRIPSVLLLISA
jgi:hypothetical protein